MRKTLLLSQALWAKYTVRLAPEAPGERHGIASSSSFIPEASARPLRLVAIGDSLVAGSGVEHQDLALTPRIAQKIANRVNRPVQWETHAKLGSTMRRVRYRFLREASGHIDILFICALLASRIIPRNYLRCSEVNSLAELIGRPRPLSGSVGNTALILLMSHTQSWFQTFGQQMVSTPVPLVMNKHPAWLFRQ